MPNVEKQKILRALGTAERWFWLMNQNRPLHFLLAASFHGTQSEERWHKAIGTAGTRHSMLHVAVAQMDDELVFVKASPRISFRCVTRKNDLHWKFVSEEEMNTPFTPESSALLRVTLLQSDDKCDLILCFHHSIADAISAMHFLHEILQTFHGVEFKPYELPESMDKLIEEHLGSAPASSVDQPPQNWSTAFRDQSKKAKVEVQTLTADQTKLLREMTRKHGATIGHAVSAAFTLAGQQLSDAWQKLPVRIFLPIDLRSRLQLTDELLYAVGISVIVLDSGKSQEGFWQIVANAKEQLDSKLLPSSIVENRMTIAGLYQGLNSAAEYAALSEKIFGFDLLQTNLGAWNFATTWGGMSLHRIAGPMVSVGFEGEQTVGLMTVAGKLTLTHLSFEPITGLLSRAIEILLSVMTESLKKYRKC
jgi:NRPS condensation-like uncharacterized protein